MTVKHVWSNKQEAYENFIEMSRNDYYTTGKLIDYSYDQILISLLGQIYQDNQIQVYLNKFIIAELEKNNGVTKNIAPPSSSSKLKWIELKWNEFVEEYFYLIVLISLYERAWWYE